MIEIIEPIDWKARCRTLEEALQAERRLRYVAAPYASPQPAAVKELDRVYANVLGYAERLTVSLAKKFYPENKAFRPLNGDLYGLIMQIDNMTTGLQRRGPSHDRS